MFILNQLFWKQNGEPVDQKKLELQDLRENVDNTSLSFNNKLNNLQKKNIGVEYNGNMNF